MKKSVFKTISFVLVMIQLLILMSVAVSATTIPSAMTPTMNVFRTEGGLTLDGLASEGEEWDRAAWATVDTTIGAHRPPTGCLTQFKSMWAKDQTGAYLYFLIDVTDPTLDSTGRAWDKDHVRIFLDEDGKSDDKAKPQSNKDNYGSLYVSSEFMSYVNHGMNSKGFEYKTAKKADSSGYTVEVKYTFQNAELAVNDAAVRANVTAVYGLANGGCSQNFWSIAESKWGAGFTNKDYFIHTGTLRLCDELIADAVVEQNFVGYQLSEVKEGKYDIRLIAEISDRELETAGFDVTVMGTTSKAKRVVVDCCYSSLLMTEDGKTTDIKASEGRYFIALIIRGIPETEKPEFEVNSFTVKNGQEVKSTAVRFKLS